MTRDALSGPLRIQRVGPPPATLEKLIEEAERRLGLVAVRDLVYVPGLLRATSDLPSPEWPNFRDTVPPEPIEVAAALAFFEAVPVEILKSPNWHLLQHQCGGVSCLQETMVAICLDPKPEMRTAFMRLATSHWGTDLGRGPPRLSELLDYRASLLDLGLDCDTSYTRLREGVYPVDSSKEALERVTSDPPDIATLLADRPFLSIICFLAPNSD
jgi:hypothetical protein